MFTKGLLGLLLLLFSVLEDQPVLKGTVTDADDSIYMQGAIVTIKNDDGYRIQPPVLTDAVQSFKIEELPEGKYHVTADFAGFKPKEKSIQLKRGKEKEVNFELNRKN